MIFPQTSRGSFSAVSTPIFASKYSLESSRRDLHNALLCTVLVGSVWVKKYTKIYIEKMHRSLISIFSSKIAKKFCDWINEYSLIQSQTIRILHFFCEFLMNFFRISRQIPENSDVCRFFNQICENKSEICRKFWILWKKFTIILNYSLHS